MLDHFEHRHYIKGALTTGQFLIVQQRDTEPAAMSGDPAAIETDGMTEALFAEIAHQPAISASVVEPSRARVQIYQGAHHACEALPLVQTHGPVGSFELEQVIDHRIGSLASVVLL